MEIGRQANQGYNGRNLMEDEKRDNMAHRCITQPVRISSQESGDAVEDFVRTGLGAGSNAIGRRTRGLKAPRGMLKGEGSGMEEGGAKLPEKLSRVHHIGAVFSEQWSKLPNVDVEHI